jgi:starch phosphorylase
MSNANRVSTSGLAAVQESIHRHATYSLGKAWPDLSARDQFTAVALSVREKLVEQMLKTEERFQRQDPKRINYLSIEYLIGRSLANNLQNLGMRTLYAEALCELGLNLAEVEASEEEPALGNGGLGRLAACFLDSLATLGVPACGYGIHYEYGLFKQEIDNGYQREKPDNWLAQGTPWEIERPDEACQIPVYGRIEHAVDRKGGYNPMWMDWKVLIGVPHDMLIPGYGGRTVNRLRLYAARSSQDFDMQIFNDGDYFKAVAQKISSETISKVLYPSDAVIAGKELRLVQEYFLVACAIRDIVRKFERSHDAIRQFSAKVAIQLNDTHPALAVAELMRVLVDEKDLAWDEAWDISQASLSFTNHTLAPESLEKWPVPLLESVLPRHLQIIYEINRRFLDQVSASCPGDNERAARMSLIEESMPKKVRMTNLAIVGSHSINGVSAMHTELVRRWLVPDFCQLWPERFNNKTNGISQRRWLLLANPALADLISATIGEGWITDLDQLQALEKWAVDAGFQAAYRKVKRSNKERLARIIQDTLPGKADPDSLFDTQVKRIHEYKRQLLNVLHVVAQYNRIKDRPHEDFTPRTVIFAGKAAPGYFAAKLLIKLIHAVANVVNRDRQVGDRLRVFFLKNYCVSLAEQLIPAADLSEQISTAGTEASGTSNMKLALNGALTIGTLDGANVEIREAVGEEQYFAFGHTVAQIDELRKAGYNPWNYYQSQPELQRAIALIQSGHFAREQPELFKPLLDSLLSFGDPYFLCADFASYLASQERAGANYRNANDWTRKAILTTGRMGHFSSDRTIREYSQAIWGLEGSKCPPSSQPVSRSRAPQRRRYRK